MSDLSPHLTPPGTLLKDNFVPIEQQEAEKLTFKAYVKERLIAHIIGFLTGSFAGGLIGRAIAGSKGAMYGGMIGSVTGTTFAAFRQWHKTNERQEHVKETFEYVTKAIDPQIEKKEIAKETAIIDDLQLLEKKLAEQSVSHGKTVTTRREDENREPTR